MPSTIQIDKAQFPGEFDECKVGDVIDVTVSVKVTGEDQVVTGDITEATKEGYEEPENEAPTEEAPPATKGGTGTSNPALAGLVRD